MKKKVGDAERSGNGPKSNLQNGVESRKSAASKTQNGVESRKSADSKTQNGSALKAKNGAEDIESRVRRLFGFSWRDFRSLDALAKCLHAPRDAASLGFFRFLFGFAMVHDVMDERHMSEISMSFHSGVDCHFPLFDFLRPLALEWMYVVYLVMLTGALCIGLGLFFKVTVWLYIIPYWYLFWLDKTHWNNHTYLYGLTSFLLSFTSANHFWSLDALMDPKLKNKQVPLWNYSLLRFQILIVYFIAGLKKYADMDWMAGWSMGSISRHWVFQPFTLFMSEKTISFVIVHLCGATLDLIGGWLLFFDKTRPVGIILVQQFHLMNAQMFSIGMFPYVMLCTTPIFCYADWPRRLWHSVRRRVARGEIAQYSVKELTNEKCLYPKEVVKKEEREERKMGKEENVVDKIPKSPPQTLRSNPTRSHKIVAVLVMSWFAWHLFLPYSHFITKGYNTWSDGLYGYSWDMMIKTWSTQHLRVTYHNVETDETGFLNPEAIVRAGRWSSHPDMIKQFARCVQRKLASFNVTDIKLYMDVWRSMTKRFQQRLVDPRVDITTAEWNPFSSPSWILPLLTELSDWRGKLEEITGRVKDEAKEGEELMPDVVFAADFPGLYLENYVQADFENTTLELMRGEIEVEFLGLDDEEEEEEEGMAEEELEERRKTLARGISDLAKAGKNVTLGTPGQRIQLPAGEYNRIHTIGSSPSCYMFIYENSTGKIEFKVHYRKMKMFERLVNASKDEPADKVSNFSVASEVADFLQLAVDSEDVNWLTTRWINRTRELEEKKTNTVFYKISERIKSKFMMNARRYGKAFTMAFYALQSIWDGIPMEEFLERKMSSLQEEANSGDEKMASNEDKKESGKDKIESGEDKIESGKDNLSSDDGKIKTNQQKNKRTV